MRAVFVLILTALPAIASAQVAPDSVARCKALVISQMDAARSRKRPYHLDLHGAGGTHLVYVGVRHTYDPADTQFVSMAAAWHALRPNTAEQLIMFFSLRIVNEIRARQYAAGRALDSAFALALADTHRRAPQLANVLPDTTALGAAFARDFPNVDPRFVPDGWFDPEHTLAETGSVFFNEVNRASSLFRDAYMFDQLSAALQVPGARVFAEVGRDHIPAQAAALRCVLEAARGM